MLRFIKLYYIMLYNNSILWYITLSKLYYVIHIVLYYIILYYTILYYIILSYCSILI